MDPIIGGALISAGTGAVNNLLSGAGSRRQNHRNVQNWKMQMEYNTPANQVKRLKEAGLNPALLYGNSSGGVAGNASGSPSAASAPQYSVPNVAQDIMSYKRFEIEQDILKQKLAQEEVNTAQLALNLDVDERTKEDIISKIISESGVALTNWKSKAQDFDIKNLSDFGGSLNKLRKGYLNDILNRYAKNAQDLSNSRKLGRLRDLQAELQEQQVDFFKSQAIVNMVAKIFGLSIFK